MNDVTHRYLLSLLSVGQSLWPAGEPLGRARAFTEFCGGCSRWARMCGRVASIAISLGASTNSMVAISLLSKTIDRP